MAVAAEVWVTVVVLLVVTVSVPERVVTVSVPLLLAVTLPKT